MEMKKNGKICVILAVFLAFEAMGSVWGDSVYGCLGGCYNECVILGRRTGSERYPCYFGCVNSCIPRSAADYRNYCQIGCNLELCNPASTGGGARLEKCIGRCGNICNRNTRI